MPLANCHGDAAEEEDTPILPGRETFVLWAQGQLDDAGEPSYHGTHKGTARLPLRAAKSREAANADTHHASVSSSSSSSSVAVPADAQNFTVVLPEMDIPATKTQYYCMYVQPPQDDKYHVYRFEQAGQPEVLKKLVHHVGLYGAGADEVGEGVRGWVSGRVDRHTLEIKRGGCLRGSRTHKSQTHHHDPTIKPAARGRRPAL